MAYKMKRYEAGYFSDISTRKSDFITIVKNDFFNDNEMVTRLVNAMDNSFIQNQPNRVIDIVYSSGKNSLNKIMFYIIRDATKSNNLVEENLMNITKIIKYDGVHGNYITSKIFTTYTMCYCGEYRVDYNILYEDGYYLLPFTDSNLGVFENIYTTPFLNRNEVLKGSSIITIGEDNYCVTNYGGASSVNISYFIYKMMKEE